jgi:hypothetical protein
MDDLPGETVNLGEWIPRRIFVYLKLMIHQGAAVKRVQVALGHATPPITPSTPGGQGPDTEDMSDGHGFRARQCGLCVPRRTSRQIKTLVLDLQ